MDIKWFTAAVLLVGCVHVSISSQISMKDVSGLLHNSDKQESKWEELLRTREEQDGTLNYKRAIHKMEEYQISLFFENLPEDEKVKYLTQMPRSPKSIMMIPKLLSDGIFTIEQIEEALGGMDKGWIVKATMPKFSEENQIRVLETLSTTVTARFIQTTSAETTSNLFSKISGKKSADLFRFVNWNNRKEVLSAMPADKVGHMIEEMTGTTMKRASKFMTDTQVSNALAHVSKSALTTLVGGLKRDRQVGVVQGMPPASRSKLFEALDPVVSAKIIESLDTSTAGEILSGLSAEVQQTITSGLREDKAPEIIQAAEESAIARSEEVEADVIARQADQVESLAADTIEEMEALDYVAEIEGGLAPNAEEQVDVLTSDAHTDIDNLAEEILSIESNDEVDTLEDVITSAEEEVADLTEHIEEVIAEETQPDGSIAEEAGEQVEQLQSEVEEANQRIDEAEAALEETETSVTEPPLDWKAMKFYNVDLVCNLVNFTCIKEATLL